MIEDANIATGYSYDLVMRGSASLSRRDEGTGCHRRDVVGSGTFEMTSVEPDHCRQPQQRGTILCLDPESHQASVFRARPTYVASRKKHIPVS